MPTMLRTSSKARKIAKAILGAPVTQEKKVSKKKKQQLNAELLRGEYRMAR